MPKKQVLETTESSLLYYENRRFLNEKIVHYFAMYTGGSFFYSKNSGLAYVQFNIENTPSKLAMWVLPPVDSLWERVPLFARFERQRRFIVERSSKGFSTGYHGMLILPPGEYVIKPPTLFPSISLSLQGDTDLCIAGAYGQEGLRKFNDFKESLLSISPEENAQRLRTQHIFE